MKGVFIVIEGIDGAGKTTLAQELAKRLKIYNVVVTQEPFMPISELLKGATPQEKALLFATDRWVHVNKVILPELQKGSIVISDRYSLSSFVYQSIEGVPIEEILELNKHFPKPDLLLLIDIDPEVSIERARQRENNGESADAWKKENDSNIEKLQRARELYKEFVINPELRKLVAHRALIINGHLPKQKRTQVAFNAVRQLLPRKAIVRRFLRV